jgi:chemotaxis methyl-accepting protein methylase
MLGSEINAREVTILATDIDTSALEHAREGVFATRDVEGMNPALLVLCRRE